MPDEILPDDVEKWIDHHFGHLGMKNTAIAFYHFLTARHREEMDKRVKYYHDLIAETNASHAAAISDLKAKIDVLDNANGELLEHGKAADKELSDLKAAHEKEQERMRGEGVLMTQRWITLYCAVHRLYYAAQWSADRPVDEKKLWEDVRDAAMFEPGNAPPPFPRHTKPEGGG